MTDNNRPLRRPFGADLHPTFDGQRRLIGVIVELSKATKCQGAEKLEIGVGIDEVPQLG